MKMKDSNYSLKILDFLQKRKNGPANGELKKNGFIYTGDS